MLTKTPEWHIIQSVSVVNFELVIAGWNRYIYAYMQIYLYAYTYIHIYIDTDTPSTLSFISLFWSQKKREKKTKIHTHPWHICPCF